MATDWAESIATFLLTDIVESTRLWETQPEAMRNGLRAHDELLLRVITVGGGSLLKHTGAGVMAVFDEPHAAVRAATAAQRELSASDLAFKVRIGVSTGTAERQGRDWFGPGPSLAAGVMGVAHGGQVVVSDSTAGLVGSDLGSELSLRDLGVHALRGVPDPQRLWQVCAVGLPSAFPAAPARIGSARFEVFVGRQAEFDVLTGILGRALSGRPAVGLVVGEAGIGKSRLVDELVDHARRQGLRVLRGEAVAREATPFMLWVAVAREIDVGPVGLDTSLAPSERRWEFLDALAEGIAKNAPVLVVVEDLHWADEASLWVLERLPRRLGDAAVAIIGTIRDDEPVERNLAEMRRLAEVVELAGLDADAVAVLARSMGTEDDVDAAALHRRTGGNPLFVREVLVARHRHDRLPHVVSDVLARALERLAPPVRHALGALAVAGSDTPLAVLAAGVGQSEEETLSHLETAARADVVRFTTPGRAQFHHSMFAEAALEALTLQARRRLHEALAGAWEATDSSPQGQAQRARHLLASLPGGHPTTAAETALRAVAALRDSGDDPRAAELARVAMATIGEDPRVALDTRARLGVALAEALYGLGQDSASIAAFEHAATLARTVDDPELQAAAEVGALRFVNPFIPQPDRLSRLAAIESRLPAGDSALRADVLGRMSVLRVITPDGFAAAHAHGDAAVAMARRLGDPTLLVRALADRHLIPGGIDGLDAKAQAADELVALGERRHGREALLHGYEWQVAARLDRLDLSGAERALERFETYAHLMPSPQWRYAAMVRRATIESFRGRHGDALTLMTDAVELGNTFQSPIATDGIAVSGRACTCLLWGIPDEQLASLYQGMAAAVGGLPVPFLQIRLAEAAWALGEPADARRCVERYSRNTDAILLSMEGPLLLNVLGSLAADLDMAEHASTLHAALAPFERRLGVNNPIAVNLPIATTLGRLALLDGDVGTSLTHHRTAVSLVRDLKSPSLLARGLDFLADAQRAAGDVTGAAESRADAHRVAEQIGLVLPGGSAHAAEASSRPSHASMRRTGDWWDISSPYGNAIIGHSVGMGHLARLLAEPGRELAVTDMAGMASAAGGVARGLGPTLDARAKRDYRRRIAELEADVAEADLNNDSERASLARLELDAVIDELRHAVGLGGRDRPMGSGAERARVNVTRNVRRAIDTITEALPALGAHLDNSVRTGRYCSYRPEPVAALRWDVTM